MRDIAIGAPQWTDMLMSETSQVGVELSGDQAAKFNQFARLLLAWNRKINLTAIVDPVEVAVKHFMDSVAPLAHLSMDGEILDLGTGGGFPGIPIKILRPGQPMTLIDGTRKKINFVKQVIRELDLDYIEAHHHRAEAIGDMAQYESRYATIVSRAVADLTQVARLGSPLLKANGKIVVYKGPGESIPKTIVLDPKRKACKVAKHFQVTTVSYTLPIFGDHRRAVILQAATP